MRIVVAPDSYKGSLSALEAAAAIEKGIRRVFAGAEIVVVPMADGGEGTVEAMLLATSGERVTTRCTDPLGREIDAVWGKLGDRKTAVIEVAAASGLPLLKQDERNPAITSTYGSGVLVRAALDSGCKRIIVGLGGSATNDGGCGLLRALGARFLDASGRELAEGGLALQSLARIDCSGMHPRLAETEFVIACDVDNPLLGELGASAVYGPQKGAAPDMVNELEKALARYAEVAYDLTGRDAAAISGSGAAGGIAAAFLFFTSARLVPGVDMVFEATGFEELLKDADVVFTGEGYTDSQTLRGKAPAGIGVLAANAGVPVVCVSGGFSDDAGKLHDKGVTVIDTIAPGAVALEYCVENAGRLLENAAEKICRTIKCGMDIAKNAEM